MAEKPTYQELEQRVKELEQGILRDKTEEEARGVEKAYLDQVIENSQEAIVISDNQGRIKRVNSEFTKVFGYSKEESLGRLIDDLVAPDEYREEAVSVTKKVGKGDKVSFEAVRRRKDGTLINVSVQASPIIVGNEQVGHYGVYRDITETKQVQELLQESEEKYRNILENIEEGYYEVDIAGNFTFVSDSMSTILGYPKNEMEGMNYQQYMDEENARKVFEMFNRVYRTGKHDQGVGWEFIRKDGTRRHVETSVSLMKDSDGHRIGFQGLLRDVTERKQAEEALKYERDFLDYILESSADAIGIVDEHGKFTRWNKRASEICGYTLEELKEKHVFELYANTEESDKMMEQLRREGFVRDYEITLNRKDGSTVSCSASITILRDENNRTRGSVSVVRDLTERKRMEKELRYLSFHDSLTGLYNRAYFEQEMHRLRNGRSFPVGIIMCDVDGLKLVNDTLGHGAGDRMLAAASRVIKKCFRGNDVVARVGGDEFSVLLPASNRAAVEKACGRIRKAVEAYNAQNPRLPLSLSIGFSVGPREAVNMDDLFKEADNNMYREKLHHGQSARSAIVETLMKALEAKDFITEGHVERLQDLAAQTAESLGLPEQRITDLRLLAQFHDIGKVGVSDRILFKPGPLTSEERSEMQRHCEIGHRIAQAAPDLAPIADWILEHHEWWNGEGYPLGLKGEEIPLECRILAIVDAYDAMVSGRPYRKSVAHEEAVAELRRCAGTQFDPDLVERFVQIVNKAGMDALE